MPISLHLSLLTSKWIWPTAFKAHSYYSHTFTTNSKKKQPLLGLYHTNTRVPTIQSWHCFACELPGIASMCQRLVDGSLLLLCSSSNGSTGAGTSHCLYLLVHHNYIAAITTIRHICHVLWLSTCMQSFISQCILANVSVFVNGDVRKVSNSWNALLNY